MAEEPAGRVRVTAAVIAREGRVLLAKRPEGGRHPGAWEFPGGKVEPGESLGECVAREMAEEMGVRVSVGPVLAAASHDYPDLSIELTAFECVIESGEPADIGCAAHAWVRFGDVAEYGLLPPDVSLANTIFGETEA